MQRRTVTSSLTSSTQKRVSSNQAPEQECDVVITFGRDAALSSVEWITRRLKMAPDLTIKHHVTKAGVQVLLVTAKISSLLKWAECTELPKRLSHENGGGIKEFTRQNASLFEGYEDKQGFFTKQERQSLVMVMVNNIRAGRDDLVPGIPLLEGQGIVPVCMSRGVVSQMFPLHEAEALKRLDTSWVRSFFSAQPLDAVSDYFGTKLGIYFAWLGHYTRSLLWPTIVGILYWLNSFRSTGRQADDDFWFIMFALFNIVWSTLYLESWKRRSAEIAYRWGTLDCRDQMLEEPRPLFKGELRPSEVTGEAELSYPEWKRYLRRYAIGWPIIVICVMLDMFVLWSLLELQFWWEKHIGEWGYGKWTNYFPKVLLAFSIGVMENAYKKIAFSLNEFENYRLEENYQNHLIVKLALFQFINSFASLFYIAFYLQDMQRLKKQLATLLIIRQVVGNVKESLIPFIKGRFKRAEMSRVSVLGSISSQNRSTTADATDDKSQSSPPDVSSGAATPPSSTQSLSRDQQSADAPPLTSAEAQAVMPQYEGTFEDYLEIFIQFGYVILFSSAFPLAALCGWLNNIVEIRSDAFKLCALYQRPFAQRARDIGTWQDAMEMMGVAGVMVNCALIGMSGPVHRWYPNMSTTHTLLLIVVLEHAVLMLKLLLAYIIPDTPSWVQVELAKVEFRRREALKTIDSPSTSSPSTPARHSSSLSSKPSRPKYPTSSDGDHLSIYFFPDTKPGGSNNSTKKFSWGVEDETVPLLSDVCCQTVPCLPHRARTGTRGTQYQPPLSVPRRNLTPAPTAVRTVDGSAPIPSRQDSVCLRTAKPIEAPPIQKTRAGQISIQPYGSSPASAAGTDSELKPSRDDKPKLELHKIGIERKVAETSRLHRGDSLMAHRRSSRSAGQDTNAIEQCEDVVADSSATAPPSRPASVKRTKPKLGFLGRTRSLSYVFNKSTSAIGRRSRVEEQERISEDDVLMPSLPVGELSFLNPGQIVMLPDNSPGA